MMIKQKLPDNRKDLVYIIGNILAEFCKETDVTYCSKLDELIVKYSEMLADVVMCKESDGNLEEKR